MFDIITDLVGVFSMRLCPVCDEPIGKGEIYCTQCGRKNDIVVVQLKDKKDVEKLHNTLEDVLGDK